MLRPRMFLELEAASRPTETLMKSSFSLVSFVGGMTHVDKASLFPPLTLPRFFANGPDHQ